MPSLHADANAQRKTAWALADPAEITETFPSGGIASMEGCLTGRLRIGASRHRLPCCFRNIFPLNARIGRDWIPPDDQSELMVSLDLPEGSSLEMTSKTIQEIAVKMKEAGGVEFVVPQVPPEGRMNHSHIYVKLVDVSKRRESNLDIGARLRKLLATYRNMRYRINFPSALGGGGEAHFYPRASLPGA